MARHSTPSTGSNFSPSPWNRRSTKGVRRGDGELKRDPRSATSRTRCKGGGMRRHLAVACTLVLLTSLTWLGTWTIAESASATCYSGSGHWYVSGGNSNNTVKSVRTKIEWKNPPDLCSSSTSYSISIVHSPGWVQVGWLKRAGYSNSMGYCERNPTGNGSGSYDLAEYSVTHQEQLYSIKKNSAGAFQCRIGGDTRMTIASGVVGFEHGDWVPVQAEAHQRYQQLGPIEPNWLEFSEAAKIVQGGSAWSNMNVNSVGSSDDDIWHYSTTGVTRGFKVNTDEDH